MAVALAKAVAKVISKLAPKLNSALVAVSVLIGRDTFTRADTAVSLGTAETGGAWTAVAGVLGIQSGAAYLVTDAGTNRNASTLNLGVSDITVSAIFSVLNDGVRIVVRSSDASNCFIIQSQGSLIQAYRQQAGVYTLVRTGGALVNGDTLSVSALADAWTVKINGATVFTFTDSFNQTAVRHGIGFATVSAGRITSVDFTTP